MAKRSIGATLVLNAGNFFTNMKSAVSAAGGLKSSLEGAGKASSSFGDKLKKVSGIAVGAVSGIGTAALSAAGFATKLGTDYKSALNDISAQTGITGSVLSDFGGVIKDIYSENYGESFEDIAGAISTVAQSARKLDSSAIKEITSNALILRDTFGYDIQESVRAVNMLIDQFGISGNEAFNLITQGAQLGLDKNGDLLDSINEYSVHFRQIGIDAEGMFNSLLNGAASGTFSVDKLGDAVKEFGIRVKDGTGDEALQSLGLSVGEIKKAFTEGGETGRKAFESVSDALFSMEDKVEQNTMGVQLFGTMWEDLGAEGIQALTDINGEFDRTYDAMQQIKNVKYDDLGSALRGFGRIITTNVLLPISEQLTPAVSDFVNNAGNAFSDGAFSGAVTNFVSGAMSVVGGMTSAAGTVFNTLKTSVENNRPAIDSLTAAFDNVKNSIANAFGGGNSAIIENIANKAIPLIANALTLTMNTASGVIDFISLHWEGLKPVIIGVAGAFLTFKGASSLSGFLGAFDGVSGKIGILKTALSGLSNAKGLSGVLSSFSRLGKAVSGVGTAIKGVGPVTTMISGAFKGLGAAMTFVTSPIGLIVIGIGAAIAIGVLLYKNWDKIKETATNLWNGAKEAFEGIKNAASEKFNVVKETIGTTMETARGVVHEKLANIKTAYEEHGGGIKGVVFAAMEYIKGYYTAGYDFIDKLTGGKLTSVKDKFLSIWEQAKTGIANIWTGIVNTVKGSINKVITGMNSMMSGAVGGINKLIGGINNISSKVGIPAIPTITAPKRSLLASGGILTRATLFGMSGGSALIGGEAGAEAVLPLDMLWNKLREILWDKETQSGKGQPNITQYINIDAKTMTIEEIADRLAGLIKQKLLNV